jgi:hypothetical protein
MVLDPLPEEPFLERVVKVVAILFGGCLLVLAIVVGGCLLVLNIAN